METLDLEIISTNFLMKSISNTRWAICLGFQSWNLKCLNGAVINRAESATFLSHCSCPWSIKFDCSPIDVITRLMESFSDVSALWIFHRILCWMSDVVASRRQPICYRARNDARQQSTTLAHCLRKNSLRFCLSASYYNLSEWHSSLFLVGRVHLVCLNV